MGSLQRRNERLSSGVTASSSVVPGGCPEESGGDRTRFARIHREDLTPCPELTLEGAQPQYHARSFNRDTRDFTASRERGDYRGARPKHRTDRQGHGSRSSGDPQSKAAWEGPRQPRSHRPAKMRAAGPQSHQGTATQGPSDKPKPQLPSEQTGTGTSESAEILRLLKELMQRNRAENRQAE
ncbi:hypothetical protein Q8A67_016798 [Cirrhinus molitorella]|uniref:Uncharacterized protein n=1 Tax=Cirrhinus molitorella TaxID=172907 RepID=A0AA88TIB6_9TELE|nr:hypothetical protein Q8A67_016798 [Cirrhinus molitorella]